MTPRDEWRVVIGFAVQPFIVALVTFCLFPIIDVAGRPLSGGRSTEPLQAAIAVAGGAALATVFVVVFGALPAFAWFLRRGHVTRRQTLLAGALLGNLPALFIVGSLAIQRTTLDVDRLTHGLLGAVRAVLAGTLIGVSAAAVFWAVAGPSLGHRADPPQGR